ncbi:LicD family protein [Rheinheimera sp. UJ51]|uniref:nucleoside-diphosphate sugar epimerase/dehydratase n=1 Tax=Rheinheimera sp. UJ51 TaxID=2892446 RepID=UPI001E3A1B6F|nr:LicD family protein [Rheinheimera sp. UJ51]MCC5450479.1 LicD family protein [Rheinheimera sp. UJ51]
MTPSSKIVLFGASKAGEIYLKKHPEHNIIAFMDNDTKRFGQTIANIPILSPTALRSLQFDTIVITSLWIDSIYQQLTTEFGIPPDKIHIPNKTELKSEQPFSHSETLLLGHQILIRLSQFFIQHQIKACVDSGTLLGLMREGQLLAWDDDIDFAIDDADFDKALFLLKNFQKQAPMQDKVDWQATLIKQSGYDVCLNIDFTPKPGVSLIPFETSLQRRKSLHGRSELLSSAGIFFAPERHFNQMETITFMGQAIPVPYEAEVFLTFMYGDWQTPKKAMTLNDYDNRRTPAEIKHKTVSISKHAFW